MLPSTSERVPMNTSSEINQRIRQEAAQRVARYRNASKAQIDRRLEELDQEWDIERTLEMNAASISLAGCVLAASTHNRRWLALPIAVTSFLILHAVEGWCPPLPILRRMGVRTMREIDEERMALKGLRGDFQGVENNQSLRNDRSLDAMAAARR